jgi:hypothetical protein
MPEINGPEIVRGAKELIAPEGPYDCIVTAKQAIADAKLDWLDFGVIGGFFTHGYEQARAAHEDNLEQGRKRFEEMIKGLNTVARNYHAVEQANIINNKKKSDPASTGSPWSTDSNATKEGVMLTLFMLAAQNLAIATMLGVAGTMAPAALAGAAMWALFTPNDEALNKAAGKWQTAHDEMAIFGNQSDAGLNILNAAWKESEAKTAFDKFYAALKNEAAQTADALAECKKSLETIASSLGTAQNVFFAQTVASLVAIIACEALIAIPIVGQIAKVTQQVLGVTLAIEAGIAVTIIGAMLTTSVNTIKSVASTSFQGQHPNADGTGVNFKDITVQEFGLDFSKV